MAYFDCIVGGSGKGNTLVVTCADELAGATITCTNGTKTYTKTCPSTSPYEVTFYGLMAGTWTVSATVSGNTYTTTVVITDYEAELGGFNWKAWVDLSQNYTSSDFTDLDDLLSDETAVRELMTIHACVDYFAAVPSVNADIETVINNDLFAKWVNNSDYALDILGANVAIKALMDEADKYGYGEWTLVGQVPTMTSNNAPYGEVSASSEYSSSYPSWKVFDNNLETSSSWISNGQTNQWVSYKFVEPVRINAVSIYAGGSGDVSIKNFRVEVSNDGTDYTPIYAGVYENRIETQYFIFDNDTAYLYYRLYIIDRHTTDTRNIQFAELQFYSWGPKGNVPVMTSNTAPYGVASCLSENSSYPARLAFDGDDSTFWFSTLTSINDWLQYSFTNPVCVKRMKFLSNNHSIGQFELRASNDGFATYDTLATVTNTESIMYVDINNADYYLEYRIWITQRGTGVNGNAIFTLQFYGRELSVSVPTMTSNTAPYGEASASSQQTGGYEAFKAFDNNTSTYWNTQNPNAGTNQHITYHFTTPIVPKFMYLLPMYGSSQARVKNFTVRGSNDGFVNDSHDLLTEVFPNQNGAKCYELNVSETYSDIRLFVADNWGTADGRYIQITDLQFYGLDYSEKEFEEGSTKKWLYDHGLELETFEKLGSGAIMREDSQIGYNKTTSGANGIKTVNSIDLTSYNLIRTKVGNEITAANNEIALTGFTVYKIIPTADMPNNFGLNISSVNESKEVLITPNVNSALGKFFISELWLE